MLNMCSPMFIFHYSLILCVALSCTDVKAQCPFNQSNVGSASCYDPCLSGNYRSLINETHRTAAVMAYNTSGGDANLPSNTWFRVTSPSGNDMPTFCPTVGHCGTVYTWWMNGTLPVPADGIVSRSAYQHASHGCTTQNVTIEIRDCGLYRVYQLPPTAGQGQGYCFGNEQPCSSGLTSANGWTPGCVPVNSATTFTISSTVTTPTSSNVGTSPTTVSSGSGGGNTTTMSSGRGSNINVHVSNGMDVSTILMITLPTIAVFTLLIILLLVLCCRKDHVQKIQGENNGDDVELTIAPNDGIFMRPNPHLTAAVTGQVAAVNHPPGNGGGSTAMHGRNDSNRRHGNYPRRSHHGHSTDPTDPSPFSDGRHNRGTEAVLPPYSQDPINGPPGTLNSSTGQKAGGQRRRGSLGFNSTEHAQPSIAVVPGQGASRYPDAGGEGEEEYRFRTPPPAYRTHDFTFHPPPEVKPGELEKMRLRGGHVKGEPEYDTPSSYDNDGDDDESGSSQSSTPESGKKHHPPPGVQFSPQSSTKHHPPPGEQLEVLPRPDLGGRCMTDPEILTATDPKKPGPPKNAWTKR